MVFSSSVFLFYFLPLFLICYFALPFKNLVLLVFSLFFYAWGEGLYVLLMIASGIGNWALARWIADNSGIPGARYPGHRRRAESRRPGRVQVSGLPGRVME